MRLQTASTAPVKVHPKLCISESLPPSDSNGILYKKGSLERKMKIFNNKIALNLDGNAEVSVTGFIAPIEYTQYDFHAKMGRLGKPARC